MVFSYKSHSCWSGQPPLEVTGRSLDPQVGRQILQDMPQPYACSKTMFSGAFFNSGVYGISVLQNSMRGLVLHQATRARLKPRHQRVLGWTMQHSSYSGSFRCELSNS